MICPLRPRRRSDPHGRDQTGPCTGRDGEPVQSGASSDFGFPVRIIPYHIPTLLIENLDIVHRTDRGPVTFMIELGLGHTDGDATL